jgi:flagellar basal body-associated protein FliL
MPEMEKVLYEEKTKNIEKSPWPLVLVLIFLIAVFVGFFYWFFFINAEEQSSEILDQLVVPEPEAPPEPEYTGPRDPFTNEPLETQ